MGGAGFGLGLLLAQFLGALGLEDPPHAFVLEPLRLDLLKSFDLGLGSVFGGGVGVTLVLELVLLVVELLPQVLEIGGGDGIVVHRRGRAVRRRGDEFVGDDLIGCRLRSLEDRHRPGAGRHVAVDRHLFGRTAQLLDVSLQSVELGLQLGHLLVELLEFDARLGPRGSGGVGAVAGRLDLGGRPGRGIVVALRRRSAAQPESQRRSGQADTEHHDHQSGAAPGHGRECSRCVSVG